MKIELSDRSDRQHIQSDIGLWASSVKIALTKGELRRCLDCGHHREIHTFCIARCKAILTGPFGLQCPCIQYRSTRRRRR